MTEFKVPRRNILIGGGATALLAALPFKAFAATPKAVCSKVGQKVLFKGKNYICKKVSGKLRWQAVVPLKPAIKTHPSPRSSSTAPSPSTNPSTLSGFMVASISELKEGQVKIFVAKDLQGRSVGVALDLQGSVVTAHSVICTHQGCIVAESGNQLACPCHGSVFDGATGAVVNGPAQAPLAAFKVAQVGEEIYIVGAH